jgi:hypothetical protein
MWHEMTHGASELERSVVELEAAGLKLEEQI